MTSTAPPSQVARGSSSRVNPVSTPRARVDTPLSAFQLPEETRQSQLDMALRRPSTSNRGYIIAIVLLALCVVALLVFLLLVM